MRATGGRCRFLPAASAECWTVCCGSSERRALGGPVGTLGQGGLRGFGHCGGKGISVKRSGKILVVCHCLLNANAKVYPLAGTAGVYEDVLKGHIEAGVGLLQLPCPELSYLGINRWGMTREQYDHPNFRLHCEWLLESTLNQMEAFAQAGFEILGIMGMDGSPNCGVNRTCLGYTGGEIGAPGGVAQQVDSLRMSDGPGVFMEVFRAALEKRGIMASFFAVDEATPSSGV